MSATRLPRLLVAAPASGAGKTTVTFGLLEALRRRGLRPAAFKCGPDYIDPLYHREVVGARSGNLDLFFTDDARARSLLARGAQGCDVAVLEGVMGLYDGLGATSVVASSYDVARATGTPVVLVLDARGSSVTLAAVARGLATMRPDARVAGVILNRCSEALCARVAPVIQELSGLRVLGCVPTCAAADLPSRHLGLVTAGELDDVRARVAQVAQTMTRTVDLDGLLAVADEAEPIVEQPFRSPRVAADPVTIAVASDRAFCFYYEENLRMLRDMGARVAPFSPLDDEALPAGTAGLYLGGGYPELSAPRLAANARMRAAVADAVAAGMPVVAECGGFMYLLDAIQDDRGERWPMVGALPGVARDEGRLRHFGYVTLRADRDGLYGPAGTELPAHEFHYWHAADEGGDFIATRPTRPDAWACGHTGATMVAGFPHVYWPAAPACAERFVRAAVAYASAHGIPRDGGAPCSRS